MAETAGRKQRAPRERDPSLGFPRPGEVLHRLRTQRGMSLRQVAAECGLSLSFLAALERGETDIALERLARLAAVFGHDVGSFLGYSRRDVTPSLFPADKLEAIDRAPGVTYRILRAPQSGYQIIQGEFAPGHGLTEQVQHEGTDLVVVTDGSLTIHYNGRVHHMRTGDCALWAGGYPHSFHNEGSEVARMVVFLFSDLY